MIKTAIVGYGNLGKACERCVCEQNDFELVGVFTRRNVNDIHSPFNSKVYRIEDIYKQDIDVVLLCQGSANHLQDTALKIASSFNTVDCYDNHSLMREYINKMNDVAISHSRLCFIGMGWDPGIFSLMRSLYSEIGCHNIHTFWGKGVSQGHSEAIRNIDGVEYGIEYTIPKLSALDAVKTGNITQLNDQEKHTRECFVVAREDADKDDIATKIMSMPQYFKGYDTTVHFIDKEEFLQNHNRLCHKGIVISASEVNGYRTACEFSLNLDSNPHFTASVMTAYARANYNMYKDNIIGAKTIVDVAISYLYKVGDAHKKYDII